MNDDIEKVAAKIFGIQRELRIQRKCEEMQTTKPVREWGYTPSWGNMTTKLPGGGYRRTYDSYARNPHSNLKNMNGAAKKLFR